MEVAKEKKIFFCDTAHNDLTCSVDSDQITCYNCGMKNPSIATLIRDGYLLPEEANYPDQVYHAAMDWQNDYQEHLIDSLMNDPETYNDDR